MLYALAILMTFVWFSALVAIVVFAVWAIIRKRQGLEHKPIVKRAWLSVLVAGVAFGLMMTFAILAPPDQTAIAKASKQSPAPTETPKVVVTEAPRTPAPTPSNAADLEKFRVAWKDFALRTADALDDVDAAQKDLTASNVIDASTELKDCEDAASGITSDGTDLTRDDDSNAGTALFGEISDVGDRLSNGCKALRTYLDTNAPSDASDAKSSMAGVSDDLLKAEFMAGAKFTSIGGDTRELLDFKTAMKQEAR